jgi:DNA-binding transcriptional ArsR family regulator
MPTAKLELFDQTLQDNAVLFRALGHPARLAILQFLAGTNSCFTGNIADELPLARTTVNQHLAELKKAGLIQGKIYGSRTNYCLNPKVIKNLKLAMEDIINTMDCCGPLTCE